MLINFFRTIIIYIFVLIVMRLMGKREIGQLQPFELAISIMIADLASIPMSETGIPISNGLVPILGLLIMHLLISIINMKSMKAREILCGKPSILVYRGKIDEKALKRERFTINELEERLRGNNVVNLGDVEYAILETSGQVTVIQKPEKRNTIPEDFNITPDYEGIPYDLVIDGKIMKENLKEIGKNYNWLKKQVEKFNMKPEEALVVTYDLELSKEKIEEIYDNWKNRYKKLAYYIEHDELEKVDTQLTGVKSYIEMEEFSETVPELDKAIFILEHINNKNIVNLKNIF